MANTRIKLIPLPPTHDLSKRSVMKPAGVFPVFVGNGDLDLVCGSCEYSVCESLDAGTIMKDMVLMCPNCGKPSDTEGLVNGELARPEA
jgi:hypothetical protein